MLAMCPLMHFKVRHYNTQLQVMSKRASKCTAVTMCCVSECVPSIKVYVVRDRQCPRNFPKLCVRVKVFLSTISIFCEDVSTFKGTIGQQEPHLLRVQVFFA